MTWLDGLDGLGDAGEYWPVLWVSLTGVGETGSGIRVTLAIGVWEVEGDISCITIGVSAYSSGSGGSTLAESGRSGGRSRGSKRSGSSGGGCSGEGNGSVKFTNSGGGGSGSAKSGSSPTETAGVEVEEGQGLVVVFRDDSEVGLVVPLCCLLRCEI